MQPQTFCIAVFRVCLRLHEATTILKVTDMKKTIPLTCLFSAAILLPLNARIARADGLFVIPGTTEAAAKINVGSYAGGATVQITASGTVDINTTTHYFANANGELTAPTTLFNYADAGSPNYPIVNGQGDGINHFVGGGVNYGSNTLLFDFAGKQTTDTTDPATIRLGTLVGTFAANPVDNSGDWFVVGTSDLITIPQGGATLYLAVDESPGKSSNNAGQFNATVTTVPEPSSFAFLATGLLSVGLLARRRK